MLGENKVPDGWSVLPGCRLCAWGLVNVAKRWHADLLWRESWWISVMRDGSRWVVLPLYQRAVASCPSVCLAAAAAFVHLQPCLRCACEAGPLCELCDLLQLQQPFVWLCYLTTSGQVWKRIWKLWPGCVYRPQLNLYFYGCLQPLLFQNWNNFDPR